MKEYIAETGGRYTYSDDILNLQELALSMTAIFSECTPFIISGCEVEGANITSGYVWLGGKVRRFEGANSVALPYYIYERNSHETVVYANDVNKRGRSLYLCSGSNAIPTTPDAVTGIAPSFITISTDAAPRLIDKFFGKYALLINSPSQRQRVDKDVTFLGEVAVEKELKSSKGVNVQHTNGTVLKAKVKESGEISIGMYLAELLKAEIVVSGSGVFSFMKGETELARIDENGFVCNTINATQIGVGKMVLSQNQIANSSDNTDTGSIDINYTGYDGSVTKFRDFKVFDGKRCSVPIFWVVGKMEYLTLPAQKVGKFINSVNLSVFCLFHTIFYAIFRPKFIYRTIS